MMATINELKSEALHDAGYAGPISQAEYNWIRDVSDPYVGTMNDMWAHALRRLEYEGTLPDMQRAFLNEFGYTGPLTEQWYQYWRDSPLLGIECIIPTGNWTSLSSAILSNQSKNGFRIQTAADDAFGMSQKSTTFEVGATYRVRATVDIASNTTSMTLRVGTAQINVTGDLVDVVRSTDGSWDATFVATATTLYFGVAISRAAFSADATVSNFTIVKVEDA
jgi:hypothetical protein